MGEVFLDRYKNPSPYIKSKYGLITDLSILIPILKDLDYPFIAQEWYHLINEKVENVFTKYIAKMNLASYKNFTFKDSKIFNTDTKYLTLLHKELDGKVYNMIAENNDNKHIKGYMFDSLVYRFKDYQEKAFQLEVMDYKYNHNASEIEARKVIRDRYNRDLIRFVEILNEAIGEHD